MKKALLAFENGHYQYGRAFAGEGTLFSEIVFNTAMSGYEEILTDPSYKGQSVVFTYPLIGNYGITKEDNQSSQIHCDAIIIREASRVASNFRIKLDLSTYLSENGKMGVDRVDTRQLTRIIRSKGVLRGGITTEEIEPSEFIAQIIDSPDISSSNIFQSVIVKGVKKIEGNPSSKLSIVAVDFGIKNDILKNLQQDYGTIYLVPYDSNFDDNLVQLEFDGIFLSNGPGDPRVLEGIEDKLRKIASEKIPITAICFGHQLIGRAFGLEVVKLPFGHHGGNHPVKYHPSGQIYITSQNHNYAVSMQSIQKNNDWNLVWENIYDNTVSGMTHKNLPINAVQFHPEASPGPNEAKKKVFGDFLQTIQSASNK
ncbi:MAG: glutamine-hydrolyzing carbamoyl-phosphate synthase small subunit [Candidatus Kapaibacteriales bacterium]